MPLITEKRIGDGRWSFILTKRKRLNNFLFKPGN
jgi:hypothetical protein